MLIYDQVPARHVRLSSTLVLPQVYLIAIPSRTSEAREESLSEHEGSAAAKVSECEGPLVNNVQSFTVFVNNNQQVFGEGMGVEDPSDPCMYPADVW